MENTTFTRVLNKISGKIALFESPLEVDAFLKEAVSLLMSPVDAPLGAVYVFDESSKELVFRVGYDKGDFWDSLRCDGKSAPTRFSLDGNEVGRAFTEGTIRFLNYNDALKSPFQSKLLIPILRGPEKIGVFLMAHQLKNAFDKIDQEDLMQAVSLLGDMLAEAMILLNYEHISGSVETMSLPEVMIGMKTSEGIIEGEALPVWADIETVVEHLPPQGSIDKEMILFERALISSIDQLNDLQKAAASDDTEMIALIFTAQMYMLKDKSFIDKMRILINTGHSASTSVQDIIREYADRFAAMTEVRLAEKAQDVRDLGFRLITNMGRPDKRGFSYEGQIVISRHIYPSDLYRLAVENVAGLVLQGTGVTAHISILARSLDLPVLITDNKSLLTIPEGTPLLLDAGEGRLYIRPDEKTRKTILDKKRKLEKIREVYTLKGQTSDGVKINVSANINILKDAKEAVLQGAEGIGLYRSEFPFILKNDFLSEEQQFRIYRSIVLSQMGKPIILRTADIGGDKILQGRGEAESNPFLGVRGIRFSLANREMFRDQLRAMLRAGEGVDLGIMLPMVSDVDEVLQAKEEIEHCIGQLGKRGVPHNPRPRIGAMVELPSAAMSVEELAGETDFLSIGTNDLTMYLLAVDRTNENLSHLYRSHHPSVLRVLATIAKEAGGKITELSVCGNVAADPMLIPFFIGLGIRKLSVSPHLIELVKQQVNRFSHKEAQGITNELLSIKRIKEMEEYIKGFEAKYPLIMD
ncbi:MAG: phosphoenolpyruvate--protein phosphotransferase [Spirochaetaceae bacterium]|jgi:phosphotransferase system enzyme I (PtsP)|nr:phosphoenolpyruvate--protein phosphotransferase [Spirochaetaceae bacterium]